MTITVEDMRAFDARLDFRRAAEWFEGAYPDVWNDPKLKQVAAFHDTELARTDPTMPYRERLARAGDETRAWIKGKKPGNISSALKPQAARNALPVDEPDDDDAEESVEDIIQQMAKSRGQQQAHVHARWVPPEHD